MERQNGHVSFISIWSIFILREHLARYDFASTFVKGRTLDIASGTGYGYNVIKKGSITSYVGADINDLALRKSKKRAPSEQNCTIVKLDANKTLPFPDNSFDTVISFETIEHLTDVKGFLQEVGRILTPEGAAIISTPNKSFFSPTTDAPVNQFHHREFSFAELTEELKLVFPNVKYFSQGNIDGSDQSSPSSFKSRIQRTLGMISGSQTEVSIMNSNNTVRYFVAVCHK